MRPLDWLAIALAIAVSACDGATIPPTTVTVTPGTNGTQVTATATVPPGAIDPKTACWSQAAANATTDFATVAGGEMGLAIAGAASALSAIVGTSCT